MKRIIHIFYFLALCLIFFSFKYQKNETFSLTIEVSGVRNSNGAVHVALYKDAKSFPDENFKNYHRKEIFQVENGSTVAAFENLAPDTYLVSVFHDENNDGKFNKVFKWPQEGIGFSNYDSVNLFNKPVFEKAAFELESDKNIVIKMIYM